jgi:hypothetical protein
MGAIGVRAPVAHWTGRTARGGQPQANERGTLKKVKKEPAGWV